MNTAGDAVQFVRLAEQDYAAASFLDARMIAAGTQAVWAPWSELEQAASGLPQRCDFIFHISHCGSTLLSRLLGTHSSIFALREPQILRSLGAMPEKLDMFLGLWSRTYHPQQRSLIKATSFVSEMAEELLARVPESRALLVFVPPTTFLRALLDGAMSDIESQAAARARRLEKRLQIRFDAGLSPGVTVAMSWLCEMLSLQAAAKRFPDRTLWLDFDQFLQSPTTRLTETFSHFRIAIGDTDAKQLIASPLMSRYAKRLEVNYDAAFRERLLQEAELKYSDEIRKGLEWLQRMDQFTGGSTAWASVL